MSETNYSINEEAPSYTDGFFDIESKEDGIYLVIYGPQGSGRTVMTNDVIHRLNRLNIKDIDASEIEKAIYDTKEKSVLKIAERMEMPDIDEEVKVVIASNRMFAAISFYPPENNGKGINYNDVIAALNNEGVIFGINDEEIHEALKEKKYFHRYLVAKGSEAINGEDGKIEFHFNLDPNKKPATNEDGSVDFHNLNLIANVRKGQTLATIISPTDGIPGKDVCGQSIAPVKGKAIRIPRGKNVKVSEDETELIADTDGQVRLIDGLVSVSELYEVPANVDSSTGDIDFIGSVIIKGNVLTGFSVKAGGNIEVYGVVEGANLIADGDIILHRGIQGMGKGVIIANGSILAKYIENSTVQAGGYIKSEAIMHSRVKTPDTVEVDGRKGLIAGGVIRAGNEVVAKVIGSTMATHTEIEVGIDPGLFERYRELKKEINEINKELLKTDQIITLLNKLQETNKLTDEKREMLVKSVRTKVFLNNKLISFKNEVNEIAPQIESKDTGKVRASSIVHSGVKVTIGTASLFVKEEIKYCTLYKDRADIRIESFNF